MPIKTKRWNDPIEADDGLRVLICRYRPRALRKENETWEVWRKAVAPSKELHAAYYGKHGEPIGWPEYERRYLQEMEGDAAQEVIAEFAAMHADGKTITLLCSSACEDPAQCHRTLLKALVEARAADRK